MLAAAPAEVADKTLSKDSSIDEILDALDVRGEGLKSFSADVKLTETTTDFGDETIHNGKVKYQDQGDSNAHIRVTFDTKEKNGKKTPDPEEFELADGKLIQRFYNDKKQTTDQVFRPGEKVNLFKLGGGGQFPLPIGQPKEDVLKQFDVKKVDPAKDDPANSVHVQLIPKPETRLAQKFKTIDAWVDDKSHMPIRISTRNRNETTDQQTDLSNVVFNPQLTDADFDLGKVPAGTWNITEQAYQ